MERKLFGKNSQQLVSHGAIIAFHSMTAVVVSLKKNRPNKLKFNDFSRDFFFDLFFNFEFRFELKSKRTKLYYVFQMKNVSK